MGGNLGKREKLGYDREIVKYFFNTLHGGADDIGRKEGSCVVWPYALRKLKWDYKGIDTVKHMYDFLFNKLRI